MAHQNTTFGKAPEKIRSEHIALEIGALRTADAILDVMGNKTLLVVQKLTES